MAEEELFTRFRPYCAILTTEPSLECLDRLRGMVERTEAGQLEPIQEYLIFPAQLHLKTKAGKTPANFTVAMLEYVQSLYSEIPLRSAFVFEDILSSCLGLVSSLKMTEDLKLHICCCLSSLVKAATRCELLTEIYRDQEKIKLPLSHLLHSLLSWASDLHLPVRLKVSALGLVRSLCGAARREVGEVMVSLVPGVTTQLAKITQNVSVPGPVLSAALSAWAAFVTTTLHDTHFQTDVKTELREPPLKSLDWLSKAQVQLVQHLEIFQPLALHSDPRVRGSVLQLARDVLGCCQDTLRPGEEKVVRLVIMLTQDSFNQTSRQADLLLHQLISRSDDETKFKFNQFIKKNVFQLIKGLDTSLGLYENQKLLTNLTLLGGFMTFLCHGQNNCDIFLSQAQLRSLVQSLLVVCKFEDKQRAVVASTSNGHLSSVDLLFDPECLRSDKPDKQFLYLRSPELVRQVESLCQTVGASNGLPTVTVVLSEAVSEVSDMRREALWVMTSIIAGCKEVKSDEVRDALKEVLRLYLGLISEHEEAVEGVGVICKVLGQEVHAGRVLSEVIAGCDSVSVLHHCLQDIAEGQGVTVRDLLASSVNHLSKDLNLRMRRLENLTGTGHGVMRLIRVVMKVPGGGHDVRDLQDTVHSLLLHLATVEDQNVVTILNIVQVFVGAMKDKMSTDTIVTKTVPQQEVSKEGAILKMIRELEAERKTREREAEELLQCPDDGFHSSVSPDEEKEEEEVEEAVTREQEWLRTVLTNLLHFISMSGRPDWQLSSLLTVTASLQLLASTPGQAPGDKQSLLLPLVHKVWQPLELCFKSSNIYLVDTAFQCVMTIARHARDFVHSRTVKEVFPPLLQFLTNLQTLVMDRDRRHTLAATQAIRILTRLCSGVWDLLELLDLHPLESDPIIQLVLDQLGTSLTVHDDSGVFDVVRDERDGRLKLEDVSSKEPLKPKRNVDKNILWLKLNSR